MKRSGTGTSFGLWFLFLQASGNVPPSPSPVTFILHNLNNHVSCLSLLCPRLVKVKAYLSLTPYHTRGVDLSTQ